MNFDFKFNATVNLSVKDLEKLIKDSIESQTKDYEVTRVDFKIADTSDDRFTNAACYSLTGCDVTLKHKDTIND